MDPKARFDRFERVQDGQARSRKDKEWSKEFEKSGQLLSDQIIATAIESFNGRLRDKCSNLHRFSSLGHAAATLDKWKQEYNHTRPHGSLGGILPSLFAQRQKLMTPIATNY
ncbi:MAG: transposase [Proteobacteria bacterium]|nr:transposase [Pseudomonadota bacterium]